MSAQRLRDAAKVLRELAGAATPGPWEAGDRCVWSRQPDGFYDDDVVNDSESGAGGCTTGENATFIATMHPGVALALAGWLEAATAGYLSTRLDWSPEPAALAVADLILGAE